MLTDLLSRASPLFVAVPVVLVLGLVVPYFVDPHCIRSNGVTGPLIARFSDIWLGWIAAHGHRSEVVHELHEKYGAWLCPTQSISVWTCV